jgi:hypothetical protein
MSFVLIKSVRSIQLRATVKHVAMTLATYADESGYCYPSIALLMSDTGLSNRCVIDCLKELERLRIITADRENGRHTYYTFTIDNYEKPVNVTQQPVNVAPMSSGSPVNVTQQPVNVTQQPVNVTHVSCREVHTNSQLTAIELPIEQPLSSAKNKSPKPKFVKPTIEALEIFFKENGSIEHKRFFNHFQSNGWRVGGKSPMVDWEAAARNWIARGKELQTNQNQPAPNAKKAWDVDAYFEKPQMRTINEERVEPCLN